MTMSYPEHARAVLVLGLPLIGGHLAQFAVGLSDTVMLGWYSVDALAAVTLAHGAFFAIFMLGSGFALAVMPMVAASDALGDDTGTRRATRMGLWLSVAFAALALPLFLWSRTLLETLGQTPEVAENAAAYLRIVGWGLLPALVVMVLKSYLAALEHTRVVLWVTVGGAVLNVLGNYVLIFGHFGAPELGLRGAAIASIVTHALEGLGLGLCAVRLRPGHRLFQRLWRADGAMLARVFRLGLPIGLTTVSEVSLFAASAFFMGWLGTVPLAAHGIVITVASGAFMVHLGLSNAATIRAGNAYGRGDRAHLARGALTVSLLSLGFAVLTSALFLLAPVPVLSLFLDAESPLRDQIIATGTLLLAIAALFQMVDGAQVVGLGLLRGVQDTSVPMVIGVVSYWLVGVPASWALGFAAGYGAAGIWFGLVLGLASAGIVLMLRFWTRGLARTPAAAPA